MKIKRDFWEGCKNSKDVKIYFLIQKNKTLDYVRLANLCILKLRGVND